jgi:hypothetical protein
MTPAQASFEDFVRTSRRSRSRRDKRYVRRGEKGQFQECSEVGRSLAQAKGENRGAHNDGSGLSYAGAPIL